MENIYDVVIVGGGAAGLSAAIYLARAKFSVLVVEKETIGGQITITDEVVNYPGVLKTTGKELTENMRQQAQNFGAEFMLTDVKKMDLESSIKRIETSKGILQSVGVVLATGASPRKLGFTGEKEYQGRGIAYCATCDGEFFSGLEVFVIGGGFAAAEEAVFLTKYASKVTIIVREEDFTCAKSVADHAKNHDKIEIHYQTEILEAGGNDKLEYAVFKDNKTGETWRYENPNTFGIFVFAGYEPATQLFKEQVTLNDFGNIITDMNQKTNLDGVYGAGDVCEKNLRQVVTAVSDGAIAATSLEKYIPEVIRKEELITVQQKTVEEDVNKVESTNGGFITAEMKQQLQPVFASLQEELVIKCDFNDSSLSKEMEGFIDEFVELSDKISYQVISRDTDLPTFSFYNSKDEYLRVKFHLVPGGHEFNSFVIAIYNAVGPGQKIDENTLSAITAISKKHNIKVMVSLSCTMCPEVVMSTQRMALENNAIETEIYDIGHFPEMKEKYKIMSVPCMVIDDEIIHFGKKDIMQVTDIIKAI
ncbi:MAG: FAD-dependent oxidoreductase [Coprobacillaceae bacterium]